MTIREKVKYILANFPATRESKDMLINTYTGFYKTSKGLTTVDREARYIQNTLWEYQPSIEEQKKRQKHSTKSRDTYRSSLETSILKRENMLMNVT